MSIETQEAPPRRSHRGCCCSADCAAHAHPLDIHAAHRPPRGLGASDAGLLPAVFSGSWHVFGEATLALSCAAGRVQNVALRCDHWTLKQMATTESKIEAARKMEGDGQEPKRVPSSLSRNPPLRLSPIVVPGGSSPQNRDGPLASKKRSASQLFNFVNDDLGVLSHLERFSNLLSNDVVPCFLFIYPHLNYHNSLSNVTDSAEVVEVLSNPMFAPVTDDSPKTFASFRDVIGGLSSQFFPRIMSSPSLTCGSCLNSSPDEVRTPSVCSNGGSATISPAVFHRLSIASPQLGVPSPALVSSAPATWISTGALATPFDSCSDSAETFVGHDLLSPFDHLHGLKPIFSSAMPRSSSEESFDGNTSGRTQFSQAVTASNPGTPVVFDCSNSSNHCFALARSSSFGELCCLTEDKSAPSPVLHFPVRSMSVSTISSALELHESRGAGGLSFLFFKRSRDGLNAVSAQTLASMLRGGSNVDPPLLCLSSAEPSLLRAGAACPLSQQLSAQAARFTVIDARYDFEFSGGCVEGAISINNESDLGEYFFPEQRRAERDGHPVPLPPPPSEHVYVFHCEYSQKRGPYLLNVNNLLSCSSLHFLTQLCRYCENWIESSISIRPFLTPIFTFSIRVTSIFSKPTLTAAMVVTLL